jgi:hypothetical protein
LVATGATSLEKTLNPKKCLAFIIATCAKEEFETFIF